MVNVQVYEIRRDPKLASTERRVNRVLRAAGLQGCSVKLFRTQDGRIGYSAQISQVLPSAEGRRALDVIHRAVCAATGYQRGRPAGVPTHQVKCRLGDQVYKKLVREAKKRDLTPSSLVADLVSQKLSS